MLTSEILLLAAHQDGVVSRDQLRDRFGVSDHAISRARRSGLIVDVVPGVVRPASSPETFRMRCRAVQLRADGCLSGWTAAHFYELRAMPTADIHVTVPTGFRRRLPTWVHLHRCSWYEPDRDRVIGSDGLVLARPLRMLFGLAAAFTQHRFERAAEDAWHHGLVTPADAAAYLERHRCRGKDGVAVFERWLDRAVTRARPTQSHLERRLLESLERLGLPEPQRQHPLTLASGETVHLDIAWPSIRFCVEPGASWWHGGDAGQRRDQARDRDCGEVGWFTIRFDETMRQDLSGAARQVARIYRRRALDLGKMPDS